MRKSYILSELHEREIQMLIRVSFQNRKSSRVEVHRSCEPEQWPRLYAISK